MGRPRVIKTDDGGEVTLKNVEPAIADKVASLLTGKTEELPVPSVTISSPTLTTYSCSAIGNYKDKDGWHVATIRFNPETKEATVDKVLNVGPEKLEAAEKFKILAVENSFV